MVKTKIICVISALLFALTLFASCGKSEPVAVSDLSLEELEKCVTVAKYKDVTFEKSDKDKQTVIKEYLKSNSKTKELPKGAVEYYLEQLKEQYKYHADEAGMKYDDLLDELGITKEDLKKEAEELVFEDIIFATIQKKENITVTDSDKEKLFDRYVTKYAEIHKYSEEYVRKNLTEKVYQTMLYDKTMEYLIINNSFK